VITMQPTSGDAAHRSMVAIIGAYMSSCSALRRSGRLKVMTPTPSRTPIGTVSV